MCDKTRLIKRYVEECLKCVSGRKFDKEYLSNFEKYTDLPPESVPDFRRHMAAWVGAAVSKGGTEEHGVYFLCNNPALNKSAEKIYMASGVKLDRWVDRNVSAVAKEIFLERSHPKGGTNLHPVLADALEDAGCPYQSLLSHLRGEVGARDWCWVVEAVIGLETLKASEYTSDVNYALLRPK